MKNFRIWLIFIGMLGTDCLMNAAVFLTVTGGQGGTPLNITINTGETFTATETVTSNLFVVFENFWDNNSNQTSSSGPTETVSLGGTTASSTTGSINSGTWTAQDLVLGFSSTSITDTGDIVLSTGQRITTAALFLNHTSINDNGDVKIYRTVNNVVSDTLTWTTVPEPSVYTLSLSCACLVFFSLRQLHRKRAIKIQ